MPADPTPTTLTAEPGASSKAHFPLDAKFPVYAIAWTDDSHVVLAGGGGSSRTGVKNRIVSRVLRACVSGHVERGWSARVSALERRSAGTQSCHGFTEEDGPYRGAKTRLLTPSRCQSMYSVDPKKRQLSLVAEHELSKEEDAPMTMAVNPKVRTRRPPWVIRFGLTFAFLFRRKRLLLASTRPRTSWKRVSTRT